MKEEAKKLINKGYENILSEITRNHKDIEKYLYTGIEQDIDKYINLLNETDKFIIKEYFGLESNKPNNFVEISKILSSKNIKYSPETLYQIYSSIINTLTKIIQLNSNTNHTAIKSDIESFKDKFKYNEEIIYENLIKTLNFYKEYNNKEYTYVVSSLDIGRGLIDNKKELRKIGLLIQIKRKIEEKKNRKEKK